ncbi:helix-turn-helix domain-containing protein [Metabacillus sp. FJAT-52054]|uniref:Helix-turn-helix domain-containing protein n=1 Tax=Metabacillus sediminis TaxID=3117746 RepID=A0ABZ2NMS4_9BACI
MIYKKREEPPQPQTELIASPNDDPLLTAKEVASILRVSTRVAYEIMDEVDFPLIRFKRQKRVAKNDFNLWLEGQKNQK